MMLAIDEADAIAPQRITKTGQKDDLGPRMLGAAEDIVRRGGQRGIGVTLISQRSAVLNKNVLTQCGVLLALRTVAAQDIDAIDAWVTEVHAVKEQRDLCISSLQSLETGEGWIWSTSFPPPDGIFKRTRFLMPETFDSSATPKVGQTRVVPKNAADVDLKAFEREMADTIEKAKADNPAELRRRIQELEKELRRKSPAKADPAAAQRFKEKEKEWREKTEDLAAKFAGLSKYTLQLVSRLEKIGQLAKVEEKAEIVVPRQEVRELLRPDPGRLMTPGSFPNAPPRPPAPPRLEEASGDGAPSKLQRAMLIALAQHPDGLTKAQILLHAGYRSSGDVSKGFAVLAREGWAENAGGKLKITEAGLHTLGGYDPLPQGQELREFLLNGNKLSRVEKAMLKVLFDDYPAEVSKGVILERAGYRSSGDVSKAFARLARYGYAVPVGLGQLKAGDELFEEG